MASDHVRVNTLCSSTVSRDTLFQYFDIHICGHHALSSWLLSGLTPVLMRVALIAVDIEMRANPIGQPVRASRTRSSSRATTVAYIEDSDAGGAGPWWWWWCAWWYVEVVCAWWCVEVVCGCWGGVRMVGCGVRILYGRPRLHAHVCCVLMSQKITRQGQQKIQQTVIRTHQQSRPRATSLCKHVLGIIARFFVYTNLCLVIFQTKPY